LNRIGDQLIKRGRLVRSLALQGGPFTPARVAEFQALPTRQTPSAYKGILTRFRSDLGPGVGAPCYGPSEAFLLNLVLLNVENVYMITIYDARYHQDGPVRNADITSPCCLPQPAYSPPCSAGSAQGV
jgi:hypothetical protein